MKNKILLPLILALNVILPAPSHADDNKTTARLPVKLALGQFAVMVVKILLSQRYRDLSNRPIGDLKLSTTMRRVVTTLHFTAKTSTAKIQRRPYLEADTGSTNMNLVTTRYPIGSRTGLSPSILELVMAI
jgi:hypothetical protein